MCPHARHGLHWCDCVTEPLPDVPILIAHRGYAARFPENTLLALAAAVDAGARHVEIDVLLSADGVPVLFHDRDCGRLCGMPGAIHDYPLDALRAMSSYAPDRFGERYRGTRIPTLAEFAAWLGRHPDVTAFVEIKRQAVEQFGCAGVLAAVSQALAPVRAQTILISFSLAVLAAARPSWPRIGVVVDRLAELDEAAVSALPCEIAFCDIAGLPPAGPFVLRQSLAVYEVDDAATARSLAARGATYIETFAIGELSQALRS